MARISRLVETHSLVPHSPDLEAVPQHSRFPSEAAYPLWLAEVLPEPLERILFLDADVLVLDDLATLWEIDLGGRVLGATRDAAIPFCSSPRGVKRLREWGIPKDAPYFNAGVMLIDLGRWRERNARQRAVEYLRSVRPIDFLHQEALNAALWRDWLQLDGRWNLLASLAGRSYEQPKSDRWKTPGIVHFAGHMKPWRAPIGGPFDARYRAFLSRVMLDAPPVRPTVENKLASIYDRHLRDYLYGCERILWNRRLF